MQSANGGHPSLTVRQLSSSDWILKFRKISQKRLSLSYRKLPRSDLMLGGTKHVWPCASILVTSDFLKGIIFQFLTFRSMENVGSFQMWPVKHLKMRCGIFGAMYQRSPSLDIAANIDKLLDRKLIIFLINHRTVELNLSCQITAICIWYPSHPIKICSAVQAEWIIWQFCLPVFLGFFCTILRFWTLFRLFWGSVWGKNSQKGKKRKKKEKKKIKNVN